MPNKTDILAIKWLTKQGYKETDILYSASSTPKITCPDATRYEAKLLYGTQIIFYSTQIPQFKEDDTILVFDKDKLIAKFLWKDRNESPVKINIVKVKYTSIRVEPKTKNRLTDYGKKGESFDELINRILDTIGEQNKKPI